MHTVGRIDLAMYEKITSDITTDEVIITEERIEHSNLHDHAFWTAIRQVDTKNNPRRRIARHYAALLRISNGVRPFFISMRW